MPTLTTENTELAIAFLCVVWLVFVFSPLRWTLRRLTWVRFLPRDAQFRDALLATRARAAFKAGRRGLARELCTRHSLGHWVFQGLVRDAMPEIVPELRDVKRAAADELRMAATTALNNNDRPLYEKLWREARELDATTVEKWQASLPSGEEWRVALERENQPLPPRPGFNN